MRYTILGILIILLSACAEKSQTQSTADDQDTISVVNPENSTGNKETAKQVVSHRDSLEALRAEVMAAHDATMDHFNELGKLEREISDFLSRARIADEALVKRANTSVNDLRQVQDDMMDWMNDYTNNDGANNRSMSFLRKEKAKILDISKRTNAAISNAISIKKELGMQ